MRPEGLCHHREDNGVNHTKSTGLEPSVSYFSTRDLDEIKKVEGSAI